MSNNIFLSILEVAAIGSCVWGMYHVYLDTTNIIALIYNGLWFILGIMSNLMGLLSILYFYIEENDQMTMAHWFLQHHYLFAWFTVILGYPTLVASVWMTHYPTNWCHVHVVLALIPFVSWLAHQNKIIITSTQIITVTGIIAQGYLCYLAKNMFGVYGALVMIANLVSLSLPTRYSFAGISSREIFIIGLGTCSFFFSKTVEFMATKPAPIQKLW